MGNLPLQALLECFSYKDFGNTCCKSIWVFPQDLYNPSPQLNFWDMSWIQLLNNTFSMSLYILYSSQRSVFILISNWPMFEDKWQKKSKKPITKKQHHLVKTLDFCLIINLRHTYIFPIFWGGPLSAWILVQWVAQT